MFANVSKSMVLAAGMLATAAPALAAQAAPTLVIVNEQQQDKVVEEHGLKRHVLVTPAKVVPGDHMVYSLTYKSSYTQPLTKVVLSDPIPTGTVLDDDGTGNYEVSVDGGKNWGKLAQLTLDDGKGARRPAQASDATHVRWVIETIAPGASGHVSFRAVVR